MKQIKTILFPALIIVLMSACKESPPSAADRIVGTYYGEETAGGNWDTTATCVVEKIDDHMVKVTCTPVAGWSELLYDSVSVTGTSYPFTLTKTGYYNFSGVVNANTLYWNEVNFSFSFTGNR